MATRISQEPMDVNVFSTPNQCIMDPAQYPLRRFGPSDLFENATRFSPSQLAVLNKFNIQLVPDQMIDLALFYDLVPRYRTNLWQAVQYACHCSVCQIHQCPFKVRHPQFGRSTFKFCPSVAPQVLWKMYSYCIVRNVALCYSHYFKAHHEVSELRLFKCDGTRFEYVPSGIQLDGNDELVALALIPRQEQLFPMINDEPGDQHDLSNLFASLGLELKKEIYHTLKVIVRFSKYNDWFEEKEDRKFEKRRSLFREVVTCTTREQYARIDFHRGLYSCLWEE